MAETKWTPGEWGDKGGIALDEDGAAHVLLGDRASVRVSAPGNVEALADAALIAAAPSLYGALAECISRIERVLPFVTSGPTGGPDDPVANLRFALDTARAALALARGEG